MASYVEFADTVSSGEILPAYRQLLIEINYCVNLFDDLENGRTRWDKIKDWTVGERDSINLVNTRRNLEKLKEEIERGIGCYIHLSIKMKGVKLIEQSYLQRIEEMQQSGYDQSLFVELQNEFTKKIQSNFVELSKAVSVIKATGVFEPRKIHYGTGVLVGSVGAIATAGAVALGTGGIGLATAATGGFAFVALLISTIAYSYAHNKAKCRALKYQELKQLSDALHDHAMLSLFQAHHLNIGNILCVMDNTLDIWDKHLELASESSQKTIENSNSSENTINATQVYDNTFRDNLQMLKETEPEMNEDTRNRMAANIAVTACKTFLKEIQGYSDSRADDFIRNLQ